MSPIVIAVCQTAQPGAADENLWSFQRLKRERRSRTRISSSQRLRGFLPAIRREYRMERRDRVITVVVTLETTERI